MATRKITRKVINPVKSVLSPEIKERRPVKQEAEKQPEEVGVDGVLETAVKPTRTKRVCLFCQNKLNPSYTDLATLRRFLTDRAKIVNKERSGTCSKHQRAVSKNIKWARHLSLFPFVPKV